MSPVPAYGLLLLTGGRGRRLGGPKHDRPHPAGGTWGGHLVRVFQEALGPGPVQVLGHPLPDGPELDVLADRGDGPAAALADWALREVPPVHRWWVVACDQVRWTPQALRAWSDRARDADPQATCWVLGLREGQLQPLGGFLPHALRPRLASAPRVRLQALARAVPHLACAWEAPAWDDLDGPEDLQRWQAEG